MTADEFAATACSELGYSSAICSSPNGSKWTEGEIATAAAKSYFRHRNELPPLPYGASRHEYKKALKAREKAAKRIVAADMAPQFGIDSKEWLGVLGAIAAFIFGGPGALVLAIVMAVVEWAVTAELDKHLD